MINHDDPNTEILERIFELTTVGEQDDIKQKFKRDASESPAEVYFVASRSVGAGRDFVYYVYGMISAIALLNIKKNSKEECVFLEGINYANQQNGGKQ